MALLILIAASSCTSFKGLNQPLAKSIPESLQKGNRVKVILNSGVTTKTLVVDQVWPDSIRMVNDTRAILISDIAQIQKRKFDPVLTTMVVVLPVTLLILVGARSTENIHMNFGKP